MSTLNRALEIAVVHHSGQTQKNGEPYALHSIRIALTLPTEAEKITALLHDIVEDTNISLADLADEGFASEILEALDLLTHSPSADYSEYIAKIATNPLARAVKIADLTDNMDLRRINGPFTDRDIARIQKYRAAYSALTEPLTPASK